MNQTKFELLLNSSDWCGPISSEMCDYNPNLGFIQQDTETYLHYIDYIDCVT